MVLIRWTKQFHWFIIGKKCRYKWTCCTVKPQIKVDVRLLKRNLRIKHKQGNWRALHVKNNLLYCTFYSDKPPIIDQPLPSPRRALRPAGGGEGGTPPHHVTRPAARQQRHRRLKPAPEPTGGATPRRGASSAAATRLRSPDETEHGRAAFVELLRGAKYRDVPRCCVCAYLRCARTGAREDKAGIYHDALLLFIQFWHFSEMSRLSD